MIDLLALLLPLPIPLVAVAVFSGAETALFSMSYQDRMRLESSSPRAAGAVEYLLARPRSTLVLILFLNMVAATMYFLLTSLALLRAQETPWFAVVLGVVNLLLMTLVGEVVSKMLAARYRVEICRVIGPASVVVFRALLPLVKLLENGIVAPLVRVIVPQRGPAALTAQELDALVSLGTAEGAIDADEQRVLARVIGLANLRIRDVMTPRNQMHWLPDVATHDDVASIAREFGLTRVPICEGTLDDGVIGMLDVKRYLARHAGGRAASVRDCLDPVRYVPDRASLDKLLRQFRSDSAKMGVCVSEHGDITGVVTTQDLVKRLVSEIGPEGETGPMIRLTGLGTWEVMGRLGAREWSEMFGVRHVGRASTVAGMVFDRLGRVPKVGDAVTIDGVRARVLEVTGRVATRLEVTLVSEPVASGDERAPREKSGEATR